MPKLKLKQNNDIGVGIKSVRQKDVASSKNDQEQSKLLKFFRTSQEDDADDKKEPKKNKVNNETTSRFFQNTMSHDTEEADESVSEFKPESKSKKVQSKPVHDIKIPIKGKKPSVKLKKPLKSKTSGKQYLLEYTKEFDQVCAIGGVDVDPEHLQLAIALSRSLTDFQGSSDTNEEVQSQNYLEPSTSYETEVDKVKRIRKTLDQYGFKVPIGPILLRPKVKRKHTDKKIMNSPLLTRSLEEKKQITSNIVSQILFECQTKNCDIMENYDHTEIKSSILNEIWAKSSPIFSKAGLKYADMNEFDMFYVKNLVTPSDSTAGCLLKDWNKIPGRDPSPERTVETLDFRETALFTNYFDDLLSSTVSYLYDKISEVNAASPTKSASNTTPTKTQTTEIRDFGVCTTIIDNSIGNKSLDVKDNVVVIINDSRSCSPDIFEDYYTEGEISDYYVSDKNDRSKPVCAELMDSDDELPNVYMNQPRKNEAFISPEKCIAILSDKIYKNTSRDEINVSIDLTQDNYFPDKSAENCQSFKLNTEEIDVIHSGKSDDDKAFLDNTTIINDSKICEDTVSINNVIDDSIDLTQNNYIPISIKSTKMNYSFDFNEKDTKYSQFNSVDPKETKINCDTTKIDITDKNIGVDDVFENTKLHDISPFKKNTQTNVIIDQDIETHETTKGPCDKDNISALQCTQNESFANSTLKINKRNKISFNSINDSIQFDQLLKDFRSNQLHGDCGSEEKESTIEDSVDLTEDDNAMNISRMRNFSQIYEGDNGIVHFESYCEENEPLDVSCISESSIKEINDPIKDKRKNVNDISLSSPEYSKNKSNSNNRVSTDSIFENSINCGVSFDNKDIDLTQSSNDSSYSHSLTQDENKILNKFQNDEIIFDDPTNKFDDIVMNVSCGEKCNEKVLRDSFSDNSAVNDVFVISDEEFNYSIGTSSTKKRLGNSKKINCNEISKSDGDSSDSEAKTSLNASKLPKFSNENDKSEQNLNTTEQECKHYLQYRISNKFDLYGSSIFDQIPSCNSSLAKDLNSENCNDVIIKQNSLKDTDIESFSARYYPQFNDLTQPETGLNCSEDLPNVYLKNDWNIIKESVQKANEKDFIVKTASVKDSKAKETPETCRYTVKTDNVTPAQNYCAMDTPRIHKELAKFGLKPLKRKRAVQMLEHIYSQTHPIVKINDLENRLKRRRLQYNSIISESVPNTSGLNKTLNVTCSEKENVLLDKIESRELNISQQLCVADAGSQLKCAEQTENMLKDPVIIQDDNLYKPDCIKIDIKHIECDPGDWVFQNKEKVKVLGCRVPLHIAFHNYLSVRSKLKDAILRYDPVNIDVIHKGLAADGYKYNSKDLFHFMDKKCITIKTTDKTGGARHHQKGK